MEKEELLSMIRRCKEATSALVDEVGKVIIGQRSVLAQMMAAIFAGGHCLLVGVPGLAKTGMVTAMSQAMALSFKRIQFTPDLMPSDITGTNVIEGTPEGKREIRFMPGPIFAHIILADEINRTPPKTQAALLEAMQERHVTVGQETMELPKPFFVIATQNPIEQEGTYPLPEAQLDRFMFNIHVDYPSFGEEQKILTETTKGPMGDLRPALTGKDITEIQKLIWNIPVAAHLVKYVAQLVRASRPKDPNSPSFVKEMVDWGAGPRAGQYLILGAKALAAMEGRVAITAKDIKKVAIPVMRHRLCPNFQAQAEGIDSVALVKKLVEAIPEPKVSKYE